MGLNRIEKLLNIGKPLVVIDSVSIAKNSARAEKKLSNESWELHHFMGDALMPGTHVIEGMGQTGLALLRHKNRSVFVLYAVEHASFLVPVRPNALITYVVRKKHHFSNKWVLDCQALVDKQKVASAILVFAQL